MAQVTVATQETANIPKTKAFDRFLAYSGADQGIAALDGLRAIAVLLTMGYHLLLAVQYDPQTSPKSADFLAKTFSWWGFGSTGVELFFVLSGFLLFTPYARALLGLKKFPSTSKFYLRRALRIVPAYWCSLILIIVFVAPEFLKPKEYYNVGLHLLFLHNWEERTFKSINGPYWTMAIETQFYLLLPIMGYLLWWFARNSLSRLFTGLVLFLSVSVVFDRLLYIVTMPQNTHLLDIFWYLCIFVCGMISSLLFVLITETGKSEAFLAKSRRIARIAGVIGLGGLIAFVVLCNLISVNYFVRELVESACFSAILLGTLLGWKNWQRLLSTPILRLIGIISYSLYIWNLQFYDKVVVPIAASVKSTPLALLIGAGLTFVIIIPFCLGFYCLVERPFIKLGRSQSANSGKENFLGLATSNPFKSRFNQYVNFSQIRGNMPGFNGDNLVFNSIQERTYVNTAVESTRVSRSLSRIARLREEAGLVIVLLAGALGLRLFNLTRLSLWQDEAYHLYVAKNLKFLDTFSYSISYNTHPPFFYPVMYIWQALVGTSDFGVRLFSVITALLTLGLVYLMARHWLNHKLGLTGLLLLALSPLHLFWSQSIRSYSWFTLLVTISMLLALLASEKPQQTWRWALYVISGIVLIYTHYYGFYAVASQGLLWLVILYKNRGALLRAGVSLGLVAVSFIPWFPNFKAQTSRDITGYLAHNIELGQIFKTFEGFSSWYSPDSFSVVVGAIFLPLYVLGAVWLWRNKRSVGVLLISWSLAPVILAWLAAQFQPNFQATYFSFCLPAFLLTVGAGAWSLQSYASALPQCLLFLAVALNLASIYNYNTTYRNQDWRAMASYIAANHQDGDLILFANPFGYLTPPFDFYYNYALGNPGKLEQHSVPYDFSLYPKPQPQKAVGDIVKDLFNAHKRVWVIWKHDENAVWMVDNVFNQVPANYQSVYKQDYPSTEQGTINFAIYVRDGSK